MARTITLHATLVKVVWTVALTALGACASAGHSLQISAPNDDLLLKITAQAARGSSLGDLRTATVLANEVELRFWGGYGLNGTSGLILHRTNGQWTATRAEWEECVFYVQSLPSPAESDSLQKEFEVAAHRKCEKARPPGGYRFEVNLLHLSPVSMRGELADLWAQLEAAGASRLPPRIKRNYMMLDGHSFVVEYRTVAEYRASVIECVRPEAEADRQVQRMAALLFERMPSDLWLRC